MDLILEKIQDLKREAELLKETCRCGTYDTHTPPLRKQPKRNGPSDTPATPANPAQQQNGHVPSPLTPHGRKLECEGSGDGDWVSAFKAEGDPWTGQPLVVLSLFDGLGGIWQALTNLGIPFNGYSSEVLGTAIQVVKARHPTVKHVGDITKLQVSSIPEKVDLVVGGFPCQDLTIMGKKEGLHGSRSKLFFDLLRVLQTFKPKWFLVENVASMSWVDREEITRHLRLPPLELDSQEITAAKRRRLYWTNIPHPARLPRLRDHPSTCLQSCLENARGWEQKCGVILCSNMYKGSTVRLELVLDNATNQPRYMKTTEVEAAMGYPRNYTNVVIRDIQKQVARTPTKTKTKRSPPERTSTRELRTNRPLPEFFVPEEWETKTSRQENIKDQERWHLLGNTFSVKVITYLTSPLLKRSVRSQGKPVNFVGSVKESELSAMEPEDMWALYNENGRPNWYAVVKARTGDRFSPIAPSHARTIKKLPLKIDLTYLEMAPTYLEGQVDMWNPRLGAGLYTLRQESDTQDSWQAFSHRVTNFIKLDDNSYFVYPGKDEVWAIFYAETVTRCFVYVVESTISSRKAADNRPGHEDFFAHCVLLQKTTEHEVFRKTATTLEFGELQPFEFRVPYHVKHEADLLKVEVSGVKSRKSIGADRELVPGNRRKRKKGRASDDDGDGDDDGVEEDDEDGSDVADALIAEELSAADASLGVLDPVEVVDLGDSSD